MGSEIQHFLPPSDNYPLPRFSSFSPFSFVFKQRIAQSISASKALQGSDAGRGMKQQARHKPDWK